MASTIPVLEIRRRLGRDGWGVPVQFGPDGWLLEGKTEVKRIIITRGPTADTLDEWVHASISRDRMPDYNDLTILHRAVWPDGWSYQCFAPPAAHINIHPYALHLWGRPDGRAMLPNFGAAGSI